MPPPVFVYVILIVRRYIALDYLRLQRSQRINSSTFESPIGCLDAEIRQKLWARGMVACTVISN